MHLRLPHPRRNTQGGFALILAILSLLLLTFLGLTLAASTSTELQIATNQRWSQAARYNAESGLQAARVILARFADTHGRSLATLVHSPQPSAWTIASAHIMTHPALPSVTATTDAWGLPARHWENESCAFYNGRVGLGTVLDDGTQLYQNVSDLFGRNLNGAVTIWVRRPVVANVDGTFKHDTSTRRVVVTAEGVAPYGGNPSQGALLKRRQQAVRLMEVSLTVFDDEACSQDMRDMYQQGLGPNSPNFIGCVNLSELRGAQDQGGQ